VPSLLGLLIIDMCATTFKDSLLPVDMDVCNIFDVLIAMVVLSAGPT